MASIPSSPESIAEFITRRRHKGFERAIRWLCLLCASISVVVTASIIGVLVKEAFLFFGKVSPLDFYTGTNWAPASDRPSYGVLPLILGTFKIAFGASLIALPLGLLAAIYLSEYATARARAILKPILELLAGIPTVVFGFFALNVITPALQKLSPKFSTFNAAAGAIVVGLIMIPLVASLCEDAIRSVPKQLRDGALGLGATKQEVTMKIVVPAAFSGIMASFILAVSRAIGETMAVTIAAGLQPTMSLSPMEQTQTMTSFMVGMSSSDIRVGSTQYLTLFAVGLTLFALTYGLNIVARKLVRKYKINYA
jgi:phosphate transport system permease protein